MNRFKPRRPPHFRLAALIGLLSAMGSVQAATDLTGLGLEKLLEMRVIAASSYEQRAAEAPSAVSVVTAEDIRTRGYRTIGQALQSMPGLYVTNDLNYTYLGSRGFNRIGDYNSRFQLSVNGLRANDALFDMAFLGTEFPLDMSLIERIEFAPGPGSSMYGSNAMLGVINIVTRSGADLHGLRVAAAVGTDNLRELAVSFGRRFDNGLEILASASGLRTDGADFRFPAFDAPETRDGLSTGQNGEHYRRGYLRATFEGFDFEVFGGQREKGTPAIYASSDFLRANALIDDIGFASLRYRREIAANTVVEARLSSGLYDYTGIYTGSGGIDGRDDASGRWHGGELRVVSTRWEGHKIVAGVEIQKDVRLDQRNIQVEPEIVYLDRHDTGRRTAVYVQDEWRFRENWLLNAGVRYDRYYSFGSSTNPRFALIGQIAPGTTVKLLHGSAFRAPNAYELYYQSGSFDSNTTLGAERSRSTEAVIEQQLGERWRWRGSLFRYRFDGLIDQVVEGEAFVYRNQGSVTGRGAELSLTALLPAGARANASASFPDVRLDDGQRATNAPRFTAQLALDAPLADSGIRGSIDVAVIGPRLDRDREPVPTSVLTNLVFTTRQPWHGATFSLGLYNALDRRNMEPVSAYFLPTQVPGIGRIVRLGAEWRY